MTLAKDINYTCPQGQDEQHGTMARNGAEILATVLLQLECQFACCTSPGRLSWSAISRFGCILPMYRTWCLATSRAPAARPASPHQRNPCPPLPHLSVRRRRLPQHTIGQRLGAQPNAHTRGTFGGTGTRHTHMGGNRGSAKWQTDSGAADDEERCLVFISPGCRQKGQGGTGAAGAQSGLRCPCRGWWGGNRREIHTCASGTRGGSQARSAVTAARRQDTVAGWAEPGAWVSVGWVVRVGGGEGVECGVDGGGFRAGWF